LHQQFAHFIVFSLGAIAHVDGFGLAKSADFFDPGEEGVVSCHVGGGVFSCAGFVPFTPHSKQTSLA
jgi:hypothetical protein